MNRLRQVVAGALAVVAIAAVGAAWLADVPDISAGEAVTAAQDALDGAGLPGEVDGQPYQDTYSSRTRRAVPVWRVLAVVRDAPIELVLERDGAQPVSIDDRSPDGASYVLSELEYDAVAQGVSDPALGRIVRRNIALTLAAVLVVAVAIALVTTTDQKDPR